MSKEVEEGLSGRSWGSGKKMFKIYHVESSNNKTFKEKRKI